MGWDGICRRISHKEASKEAPWFLEVEGETKGFVVLCGCRGVDEEDEALMIFEGKVAATYTLVRLGQVKAERIHLSLSTGVLNKNRGTKSNVLCHLIL